MIVTKAMQTLTKQVDVAKDMRSAVVNGDLTLDEVKKDLRKQLARKDSLEVDPIPYFSQEFPRQDLMVEAIAKSMSRGFGIDGAWNPSYTQKDVLATVGGAQSVLIRTDIMPHLYNIFVAAAPFVDWANKELANGLSHTWDVRPSFATTQTFAQAFVDDLGTAVKDQSPYNQLQTLVAIGMTERGSTFRMRYAMQQSGMTYDGKDANAVELEAGADFLGRAFQNFAFQGEVTNAGKTGTDEFGTYGQFAFDGMRAILGLPTYASGKYYPASGTNIAVDNATDTLNKSANDMAQQLADAGGNLANYHVWMDYSANTQWSREEGNLLRIPQGSNLNFSYGVAANALIAGGVELPLHLVPGTDIGFYTPSTGYYTAANQARDVYFLDKTLISYAHLGPATPFVIEIPPGVDGTLTSRFIIAWLASLTVKAPALCGKLRISK